MEKRTLELLEQLANKIPKFKGPVHILAVCTGGVALAKLITKHLRKKGVDAKYFEIWTNIIDGVRTIERTNFKKSDYVGVAIIVDDVIWAGTVLPPIKKMLKKYHPKKRIYVASLLDCCHKADFAVFR